jgi:hypothetical protein
LVLGQLQQCRLAGRVDRTTRGPELAANAPDVDDRIARFHLPSHLSHEDGAADEVHAQGREPLLSCRFEPAVGVDDGVVDEHVDVAEPLDGRGHARLDRFVLADVRVYE